MKENGDASEPSTAHSHPDSASLRIENLGFSYAKKTALANFNLNLEPGELAILLGPNGAGKTTLFSLICGLFSPDHGSILIKGKSLAKQSDALAPLGIVFQSQTLDLDLSVEQNLLYFCSLHGIARVEARERVFSALQRLDMQSRIKEKVRTLNGGHRRRVEIIRATLHQPSILLLDEPTVGLDIPTRAELLDYLRALPADNQCAVLWATHLIDEIRDSDRVVMLDKGRCAHDGVASELLQQTGANDLSSLLQSIMEGEPLALHQQE